MNPPPPTPCYLLEYLFSFGTNYIIFSFVDFFLKTNLEYSMKAARSERMASSLNLHCI
jgi:hypothetical protein